MNLESQKVFSKSIESGEVWLNNVTLPAAGNYADSSTMITEGYTTLTFDVRAITGSGLKLSVYGNVTDAILKELLIYDENGELTDNMTAPGFYSVDVSGINAARIYVDTGNTATEATIWVGYGVNSNIMAGLSGFVKKPLYDYIEKRTKIIQVVSTYEDAAANDVLTIVDSGLDVSEYSYISIRVRSRDATTNTYETRDFDLKYAWIYEIAANVSTDPAVNGAGQVTVAISETAAYDSASDWIEIKSPTIGIYLYNGETSIKRYEIDIIAIR